MSNETKKMRESSKAALCGVIAALSVVIMLITYISPFLVYTAPPFAGMLLLIVIEETGKKRAFATYVAISLLSIFIIADKEAAVFFTLFFGYYPILKSIIDKKINSKVLRIPLKFIIFNTAVSSAVIVSMFVFKISYDDFNEFGKFSVIIFAALLNIFFVIYDKLLIKLTIIYELKFKKRIQKLFTH